MFYKTVFAVLAITCFHLVYHLVCQLCEDYLQGAEATTEIVVLQFKLSLFKNTPCPPPVNWTGFTFEEDFCRIPPVFASTCEIARARQMIDLAARLSEKHRQLEELKAESVFKRVYNRVFKRG